MPSACAGPAERYAGAGTSSSPGCPQGTDDIAAASLLVGVPLLYGALGSGKKVPQPPWGKRADRAYLNAVESFAPFAALVIIAHVAGKANAMTAFWATCYFWIRLAHAAVYLLGLPLVRTILFTLGYIAVADREKLKLSAGWELVPGTRAGDLRVARKQ